MCYRGSEGVSGSFGGLLFLRRSSGLVSGALYEVMIFRGFRRYYSSVYEGFRGFYLRYMGSVVVKGGFQWNFGR